jgi:hypothetical protein
MQPATASASESLDLSTITAEKIYDLVPDVGFFFAEDIVAWRDAHGGTFPDEKTLVGELGLAKDIAADVARLVIGPGGGDRPSGVMPQGSVVAGDAEAEAQAEADAKAEAEAEADARADAEAKAVAPDSGPYLQADGFVEVVEPVAAVAAPRPSPVPPPLPPSEPPPAVEPPPVVALRSIGAYKPVLAAVPAVAPPPVSVAPPAPVAVAPVAVVPMSVAALKAAAAARVEALEPAVAAAPVAVAVAPARGRRWKIAAGVLVLVAANAGLAFGIVQTRREGRRAVAPIGAITSDLAGVKSEQAESRSALDATRNELEETKRELAKQASLLQATTASANELAAHQKATDRELKDLSNREAADVATLAARLRERRNADGTVGVNLGEAIQLIDAAQGKPPAPPKVEAPPPSSHGADHEKPAATPLIDW